jgi:CheY-like chemotaxis protein
MKYAPLPPVRQPPGRILVVDDLQSNRDLIQTILTGYGYEVRLARDGEEAMELIHREPPDLVLSDIRMPNCDGFELCRAVNSEPSTRLIPVVLMTGAAEEADRLTAIEAGAQDFRTSSPNPSCRQSSERECARSCN